MGSEHLERLRLGKRGELFVFGELLRRGVVPYSPIVDIEGVDCIIRKADGAFLEVQVKTINTPMKPRWWQATAVPDRDDYVLVLLGLEPFSDSTWIMTGRTFREHATRSGDTFDLDLDSTRRGGPRPRGEELAEFRGRWDLLVPAKADPAGTA